MKTKALILAAGYGNRLKPFTDYWPKCLMPINGHPLLEIWLDSLLDLNIQNILVNTHHFSDEVLDFLNRKKYKNLITSSYEYSLLGSAGTIRKNYEFLSDSTLLAIHGDNFCTADLNAFYNAHFQRPSGCLITMMTFNTNHPESCGIVEINDDGTLLNFHEKVKNPPGNRANGAIYLIEQEVLDFIYGDKTINDFTNQVIPYFINEIYTWHNDEHHIDIGTPENLSRVQSLSCKLSNRSQGEDNWEINFKKHIIHQAIKKLDQIKEQ